MSTRDEYVAKMQAKLDEWNAQIDELEAKARRAKAQAAQKHQERIAELNARETKPRRSWKKSRERARTLGKASSQGLSRCGKTSRPYSKKARTPSSRGCKTISNHFPTRP